MPRPSRMVAQIRPPRALPAPVDIDPNSAGGVEQQPRTAVDASMEGDEPFLGMLNFGVSTQMPDSPIGEQEWIKVVELVVSSFRCLCMVSPSVVRPSPCCSRRSFDRSLTVCVVG